MNGAVPLVRPFAFVAQTTLPTQFQVPKLVICVMEKTGIPSAHLITNHET